MKENDSKLQLLNVTQPQRNSHSAADLTHTNTLNWIVSFAPEVSDEAALLRQVQKFDEEFHPLPRLFGREAVDSAKEPERVADGELVIQCYVLPRGEKNIQCKWLQRTNTHNIDQ